MAAKLATQPLHKGIDVKAPARPKVKVLLDCHTFDTGWHGTTTYLAGVLNALPAALERQSAGLEVELYCAAAARENVGKFLRVPFHYVSASSGFLARNARDIPRAEKHIGADLVVSQYVRPFAARSLTMSVIHDVLFLDYPQSFSWRYRKARALMFGWSARNSDVVSTVSHYSAQRIASNFGISKKAIKVIPNGVDPAFANITRPRRDPDTPLQMISVSRLEQRKRHEWGLAAQRALKAQGIEAHYTIIGAGDDGYADSLRHQVKAAQRDGFEAKMLSGLTFEQLLDAYAGADLFLFPSEAEGFGIPVIEAGAAGVPAIVSDGGALAELKDGFSGLQFAADDKDGFISATLEVARNIDAYSKAAADKRNQVAKLYSWDSAADDYARIIREIAQDG